MTGPIQRPLTVEESDDSVIVRPCTEISFNAADFTVAATGQQATISIDATGAGATLTDTYVGYGNASDLMTGSAAFTFNATNNILQLGPEPGGAACQLRLIDHNTEGGDKYFTELKQSGASLYVENYDDDATTTIQVARLSNSYARWNYNQANVNFSIGTTGFATLVWVDGRNDNVGIGTTPNSAVERLHVKGTGTGTLMRLESTDDGTPGTNAPDLQLLRSRTTTIDPGDDLGLIAFAGEDSAGNITSYAQIAAEIDSPTDTDEAGRLEIKVRSAQDGSTAMRSWIRLLGNEDGTQDVMRFNEDGDDIDLLYEDSSAGILVKFDAANSNVGIGAAPTTSEAQFQVDEDATFNTYIVNKTDGAPNLSGAEVKNTLVVMNYSGGAATPNITSGTAGESVTILNVDASNTVTVTAGPGITFLSTAAALNEGESEKWVCYKANSWVRVATET